MQVLAASSLVQEDIRRAQRYQHTGTSTAMMAAQLLLRLPHVHESALFLIELITSNHR